MKKLFLSITFLILAISGAISVSSYFQSDARQVKSYVEEKYGFAIEIKDVQRTGIASDKEFIVTPENDEDLEFSVVLPYSEGKITDNYSNTLETHQELEKFKTVMEEARQLGFTGYKDNEIKGNFAEKKNADLFKIVYIGAGSPIEISEFDEKEGNRFFELQKLVKQSGASIDRVLVSDKAEPVETSIVLEMDHLENVNTKETFLLQLRRSNWELASYYENKQWESEKEKVENDRFTFDSEYDDYWFNCRETNEKGNECTNILVPIYFENLSKSNSFLEEDVTSIFTLFEKTIAPGASIEYSFIEKGSDSSIRYTNHEISQFNSTTDFVNEAFK